MEKLFIARLNSRNFSVLHIYVFYEDLQFPLVAIYLKPAMYLPLVNPSCFLVGMARTRSSFSLPNGLLTGANWMLVAASNYARRPSRSCHLQATTCTYITWRTYMYAGRILPALRQDPFSVHCPTTLAEMNIPRSNVQHASLLRRVSC